jgi:hypothetical protein
VNDGTRGVEVLVGGAHLTVLLNLSLHLKTKDNLSRSSETAYDWSAADVTWPEPVAIGQRRKSHELKDMLPLNSRESHVI